MRMCCSKKRLQTRAIVLATVLTMALTFPVFAAGTSLDDVVTANETTQATTETREEPSSKKDNSEITIDKSGSGAISGLTDSVNFSSADETVQNIQKSAGKPLGIIIQLLAYGLTVGLTIRVLLDLIYIALPFFQDGLSGGRQGVGPQGQQQQGGFGGGGFGGGGFGGGGFGGGGFGGNSFGGGGFGQQGQQQQGMGKCYVSQEALNALAVSKAPGPDGRPQSAFRYYFKSMTEVCVITPIMITLCLTGVMAKIGFMLGNILTNALSSFL